jgi:alpha-2-macroglobulin
MNWQKTSARVRSAVRGIIFVCVAATAPVRAEIPNLTPQAENLIAEIRERAGAESQQTEQGTATGLTRGVVLSAPEAALARDEASTTALSDYALWLYRNGRLDDAAAISWYLSTRISTARGKSGALTLMAEARVAQGRTRDAVEIYTRAAELDSGNERLQRRLAALQEKFDFRISELNIDPERDSPTACVTYTAQLRRPLPIKPQDYVKVSPAADVFVYAAGNRLCVKGLQHGKSYKITYRSGIPSAGGAATARDDVRDVVVGDRTARIQFGANRFILPRAGKNLLPIKTVNLDRVNLRVMGVGERALIDLLRDDTLGRAVSGYSADDIAGKSGRDIWKGYVQPKNILNREVTTLLSMDKMVGKKPVGVYVVVASAPVKSGASGEDYEESWRDLATQWVIVSDIGLSAFKGSDGLTVFTRSLDSAKPASNVTLQLVARNNDILGSVVTNADGKARFAPGLLRGSGGAQVSHVIARSRNGDLNILRLDGAALDLSERGVEGAASVRTQLDAFLYTERGIYRPGETVRVSALLRSARMAAQPDLPLLFGVYRPDGTEFYKVRVTGDRLGSYDIPVNIPAGARSGSWEVRAYLDPKQESLGNVRFRVEDFVPQRIELTAKANKTIIDKGEVLAATAIAKFYYGPPAADLPVEIAGDVVADDTPFEKYAGYQFGRVEENFENVGIAPQRLATDAAGNVAIAADLGDIPDTTRPLKARLGVTLFDVSGRPIYQQVTARVRTAPLYVGIKAAFAGYVGENQDAPFEIVALSDAGAAVAGRTLEIAWVREDYDYSWYVENGSWYSRTTVTDITVGAGTVKTNAQGRAKIARGFTGGRYRVEVRDPDSDAIATYRFDAGWWSSGETTNAPDALELNLKSVDVSAGGTLTAFVKAPFDGEALVAIVSSDVVYTTTASVSKAGSNISVPVSGEWGAGAYLMVAGYRPKLGMPSPLPARAMGLAWFGIDKAKRTLPVTLTVPAETLPRQKIELPVKIAGASGTVGMTIAAVDEGVLALTRFKTPRPEDHYLGQRQLGLDVYDHYGSLIQPAEGAEGNLRTGGDAAMENATGNTTRSSKVIALFTRQVSLDGSGNGKVTFELPDFNGRLRLMAVAWSDKAVGSGDANLIVRDPVVTDVVLPRFIAPGDKAQATLSLHNVSGKTQPVSVVISGANGLLLATSLKGAVTLKNGERRDIPVTLLSNRAGDTKVFLKATVGNRQIAREWDLAVRPASTITTRRVMQLLKPGESVTLNNALLSGFVAGTATAKLSVTNRPDFDVPGLLDYLDQYPYGCTEQTTSSALPLLYFADVAKAFGRDGKATDMKQRVDKAILKLLERQTDNGGLGFWSASDKVDPWASAYAFDFLTRAKQQGHYVPPMAYDNLRRFLANHVNASAENNAGVAQTSSYYYYHDGRVYALYALARAGFIGASDVRYFAQNEGASLSTRLAKSQLAGALAAVGETKLSNVYFAQAARLRRPAVNWWDYGSDTRDAAASLVILAEAKKDAGEVMQIAEALERSIEKRRYYWSTQEAAWLLIAAHHVMNASGGGDMNIIAGAANYTDKKPFRMPLAGVTLSKGFVVKNNGNGPLRVITSVRGAPVKIPAATANGFSISRRVLSMSGAPLDAVSLKQNARVVIVIDGVKVDGAIGETLVTDLLPAGLEIESILGGAAASGSDETAGSNMPWLGSLTPLRFSDARDDRFVAAMNLDYSGGQSFRLAYIARAITPGAYVHPGVYIEDMYQPQFIARGNASRMSVVK